MGAASRRICGTNWADRCIPSSPGWVTDVLTCRDRMRARIPASSGLFAMSREISLMATAWWGWEDSNFQPNDYRPLALSSLWRLALNLPHSKLPYNH